MNVYVKKNGVSTPIGGDCKNTYSITEHVVGTWIDGKSVYELVYSGTTGSGYGADNTLADLSSYSIDTLISLTAIVKESTNNHIPIMCVPGNPNTYTCAFIVNNTLKENHSASYSSKPITVILRYTKTTD